MPTPITAIADAVAPARLGRAYRSMLGAVIAMNIGDGVVLAAGPLLVASLTRDPFLVSLAFLADFLPSLVFGTFAGVIADRLDRRRIVILVNLGRAAVLMVLAGTIVTGTVSIAIILATLLVLGTAETFGDLAASSLLPRLVPRADLGIANARMQGAYILTNQLVGPPIGAFLFVAGMAVPFAADAACYVLGAVLFARIAASTARPDGAAVAELLPTEGAPDGPARSERSCTTSRRASAGCAPIARCGPSSSRSWPSTSRSGPRGRCWSCTRAIDSAWTTLGSAC